MIKTTAMILEELSSYASPKTRLSRMVNKGECFRVTKGLYETEKIISPHLLAGSIYGPSYISFEYALSFYGLIPEAAYTVTCATFERKKKKKYDTPFGVFTYQDVPSAAFPLSITLQQEGDYWYRIATPEKALCDQLYSMRPAKNAKELDAMLYDDLRIEDSELRKLNWDIIRGLSDKYHATNIKKLCILSGRL